MRGQAVVAASVQVAVLAGISVVTAFGLNAVAQTAVNADSLKRRAPMVTDHLLELYRSPEYDEAYTAAQEQYRSCQVTPFTPAKWQTYKQYQWLAATQLDLATWTATVAILGKQLENRAVDEQSRINPHTMAQIREIEDDFSVDSTRTLNHLVEALPLKDLFNFNHLPDLEQDWYVRKLPTGRNTGLLETVSDFAHRVNAALTATKGARVHFQQTSKFPSYADYLLDEKGKPITRPEPYYVFWQDGSMNQSGTVAPVQKTMVDLHAYLARAQATISSEGLLTLTAENPCKPTDRPSVQPAAPIAHTP